MSFLSVLKTIENDVLKGIEVAGPIVGRFVPAAGPIMAEIAAIIIAMEGFQGNTNTADPAALSSLMQAVATVSTVKQQATGTSSSTTVSTATSSTTP